MLGLLLGGGLVAGLIDSLAGGGGLITVPLLMLALGPGPHALGTNKIVATLASGVALLVYLRSSRISWRRGSTFIAGIAGGAYLGSLVSPWIPASAFILLLAISCPMILWCVWRKDIWVSIAMRSHSELPSLPFWILGSGIVCGFYDGVWGPGGGTFMLLALLFAARLPLTEALVTSKLANLMSAGVSLFNFWRGGYVHWDLGIPMGIAISVGAFGGAFLGTRMSSRAVRPALATVSLLLLARLAYAQWG